MKLLDYLKEKTNIDSDIIDLIDTLFEQKHLPKGTIIIEEGHKNNNVYYFEEGLAYSFYNKDGKEITHFFFSEQMFYTSLNNIIGGTSPYSIKILENSTVWVANYFELEKQTQANLKFQQLKNNLLIDIIQRYNRKLYGIQFQSAKERYEFLLKEHPNILQRVPLGHIASYLGITQQRLSVIRGVS